MPDKYEILDNNREPHMKPIEEVQVILNGIVKDVSSIRSDMAVIKSRLYELIREKEALKKEHEDNISKGWGWGFY